MNLKTQKGITLIALIVTVVIILILVSTGTYVGINTIEHSRLVKFVSYMQVIQKKVDAINNANEDYSSLGETLTDSGKKNDIINVLQVANAKGEIQTPYTDENESNYRYFNKTELAEQLNIENIEDEIVINFLTREVVSLNGIEYESTMYYTQYLLPTGQKIINREPDSGRDLDFNVKKNINGLKATITFTDISITNGTLSYKEENGQEKVINNYTKKNMIEEISISKSGKYIFKLTDNSDSNNSKTLEISILLGNSPELLEGLTYIKEEYDYSAAIDENTGLINISLMNGASATAKDESNDIYYWIPRFAYKIENGNRIIKLVKGNSLITTDNDNISITDDSSWTIPEEFSNSEETGFLEKTGIWLKTTDDIVNILFQ